MTVLFVFVCLFGVLRRFQHCTGHITTGSWKGRGNQYIEFARVLYCKLPTNGKQLPAFPLQAMTGIKPRPQRWEARVLPLCHCGPPTVLFVRLPTPVCMQHMHGFLHLFAIRMIFEQNTRIHIHMRPVNAPPVSLLLIFDR